MIHKVGARDDKLYLMAYCISLGRFDLEIS